MDIHFHFADARITLNNKNSLKQFLADIFKKEKRPLGSLHYIFCSDEYLLNINKQFLQHDYYTDIITFDLSQNKQKVEGEIYISVDRVKDNAKAINTTVREELHRVIFHGVLHLCGYKDKAKTEIVIMRAKENDYLHQYFK